MFLVILLITIVMLEITNVQKVVCLDASQECNGTNSSIGNCLADVDEFMMESDSNAMLLANVKRTSIQGLQKPHICRGAQYHNQILPALAVVMDDLQNPRVQNNNQMVHEEALIALGSIADLSKNSSPPLLFQTSCLTGDPFGVWDCVTYIRLDGSVEREKRFYNVKAFNSDITIDVFQLTKHGMILHFGMVSIVEDLCLCMNTSFSWWALFEPDISCTLVFIEHDWNPMRDHQAVLPYMSIIMPPTVEFSQLEPNKTVPLDELDDRAVMALENDEL
ncbi:hypothetical protein BC332_15120 [Capsicum chinense]|nr:hypothetical protein BC332_15120 [Capsicum chinense]